MMLMIAAAAMFLHHHSVSAFHTNIKMPPVSFMKKQQVLIDKGYNYASLQYNPFTSASSLSWLGLRMTSSNDADNQSNKNMTNTGSNNTDSIDNDAHASVDSYRDNMSELKGQSNDKVMVSGDLFVLFYNFKEHIKSTLVTKMK